MNIAIVPVKELWVSKQRLSPILTPAERARLSLAMFQDVLSVLGRVRSLDRIGVVTRDPEVAREAEEFHAEVVAEVGFGLNLALAQALELRKPLDWTLIYIPGDVPCLIESEVESLVEASAEYDLVLVPDAERCGTNGLALRPPDLIPFRFEGQSLAAYTAEARKHGWRVRLFPLETLSWDVDLPSDLIHLRRRGSHTRAFQCLKNTALGGMF
jgi:2-phospho-L-lactate guanylyltransferase